MKPLDPEEFAALDYPVGVTIDDSDQEVLERMVKGGLFCETYDPDPEVYCVKRTEKGFRALRIHRAFIGK